MSLNGTKKFPIVTTFIEGRGCVLFCRILLGLRDILCGGTDKMQGKTDCRGVDFTLEG
ncbi:Hypothetical protein Cp106_1659 [Corynebacterium pseudotuberculosis 1/06-A]|nr:Hypothetical protein Cp106_1659 [Corynebacterium pseudotuberculosis 1/06-A]